MHIDTPRSFVMMLNPNVLQDNVQGPKQQSIQPPTYLYARIIQIFHVFAVYAKNIHPRAYPERRDILLVWWFRPNLSNILQDNVRLERLSYLPFWESDVFSLIDPTCVLRAAHIVPAFLHGLSDAALNLPPSIANDHGSQADYTAYYANWYVSLLHLLLLDVWRFFFSFADRDMLMRSHPSISIGHRPLFSDASMAHLLSQERSGGCLLDTTDPIDATQGSGFDGQME